MRGLNARHPVFEIKFFFFGGLGLFLGNMAKLNHLVQAIMLPVNQFVNVAAVGRKIGRSLGQSRQNGGLGQS